MSSKKLNTNVLTFKEVGGNILEPVITKVEFATCIKCKKEFTEYEWDTAEKEIGWQTVPSKINFEGIKIKCSKCNQLNMWTRPKTNP